MKRRPMRELLDDDAGTPAEVAASLQDLRWFNRWFGGMGTVRALVAAAAAHVQSRETSILEVASGDGYILQRLRGEFEPTGTRLKLVLLDRASAHLPRNGSVPKVVGDALKLPLQTGSFDFVSTSLFVHHLPPQQVVDFAVEALRVCRRAVLVHDLIRHPLHLALAYAGLPLYRSRLTRNDAPASVWQAYTVDEMSNLLRRAGARHVQVETRFLYRMGVLAWKNPAP